MQNTTFPSPVNDEINALEKELHTCWEMNSPVDLSKMQRLYDLRSGRVKELVSIHQTRSETMKDKTREMTAKLSGLNLKGKPDVMEKIFVEQDRYDKAAVHWAISENCPWEESEASSIMAGLLIMAAQ